MRIFLGYDQRFKPEIYLESSFIYKHRDEYLINPLVRWPLSVDKSIWPSVFQYSDPIKRYLPKINDYPTSFQHECLELWTEFSLMLQTIGKETIFNYSVSIAIFLECSQWEENSYFVSVLDKSGSDIVLSERFVFAGFDIADTSFLSGLTNCAYRFEEKKKLLKKWGCKLNQYGLFSELKSAREFLKFAGDRCSEHSPFYIFGLFVRDLETLQII